MKAKISYPYAESAAVLPKGQYVGYAVSTDLPHYDVAGPSVCIWQIDDCFGQKISSPGPKRGRRRFSDEHRAICFALIGIVESLAPGSQVLIYIPYKWVVEAIELDDVRRWRSNNWRKNNRRPIANPEVWEHFLRIVERRKISVMCARWSGRFQSALRKNLREQARAAR
jgi:hypothetical protein